MHGAFEVTCRRAAGVAADLLWPPRCGGCDLPGVMLCDRCRAELPIIDRVSVPALRGARRSARLRRVRAQRPGLRARSLRWRVRVAAGPDGPASQGRGGAAADRPARAAGCLGRGGVGRLGAGGGPGAGVTGRSRTARFRPRSPVGRRLRAAHRCPGFRSAADAPPARPARSRPPASRCECADLHRPFGGRDASIACPRGRRRVHHRRNVRRRDACARERGRARGEGGGRRPGVRRAAVALARGLPGQGTGAVAPARTAPGLLLLGRFHPGLWLRRIPRESPSPW